MHNRLTIHIDFSFKGETFHPRLELDLDALMGEYGQLPDFYLLLARHEQIDTYSYLYEVMCAHEIVYSDPCGLACEFQQQESFDHAGFEQAWRAHQHLERLAEIAREHMAIADLGKHPDLQHALLAAFQHGQQHPLAD